MAFDQGPVASGIGILRSSFGQEDRGPVQQRAINDVAVAGDPPRIGHAEIDIGVADVEDLPGGGEGPQHVPQMYMDNALGLPGRP